MRPPFWHHEDSRSRGSACDDYADERTRTQQNTQVAVFEAHDRAGGAAHEFDVAKGYRFERGPGDSL